MRTTIALCSVLFAASTARGDAQEDLEDAQNEISKFAADIGQLRSWAGNHTERTVAGCHKNVDLVRKGGVKTLKGMWYDKGKKVDATNYEITLAQADELCDDFGRWLVVNKQYGVMNFAYDQLKSGEASPTTASDCKKAVAAIRATGLRDDVKFDFGNPKGTLRELDKQVCDPLGPLSAAAAAKAPPPDTRPKNEPPPPRPLSDNGKRVRDIAEADQKAPPPTWTPVQQWRGNTQLFHGEFGYATFADELGSKLSQLGRARVVVECFMRAKANATDAIIWAMCGDDVAAVDLKGIEAELKAEGISDREREDVKKDIQEALDKAKKVGAAVEAAAKDDPGVAAVLAAGKAARAEWRKFAESHAQLVDTAMQMQAAAYTQHAKNFPGCADKTRPAFEKLVRSHKFVDGDGDQVMVYVNQLRDTPESYLITLAWGACAMALDQGGEGIYAGIAHGQPGRILRGERTYVLVKLFADSLKPKFADRSLNVKQMRDTIFYNGGISPPGNDIATMMTPSRGKLKSVKAAGDTVKLGFSADKVDGVCLQWRDTKKVTGVSPGGDVQYEKECVKRGSVDNQTSDVEISSLFVGGLKPGVNVIIVHGLPVVAWVGKKNVAILGVELK
jgi:hypothetical protein